MRNLRYKTNEQKEREAKNNIKTGKGTKHKRLLNIENRGLLERLWQGEWAKWVRGLRNLLLKSPLHHMLTNLDVNYKN